MGCFMHYCGCGKAGSLSPMLFTIYIFRDIITILLLYDIVGEWNLRVHPGIQINYRTSLNTRSSNKMNASSRDYVSVTTGLFKVQCENFCTENKSYRFFG